jgi:uncharacterized protein (PEP-CTERM system associated)
MRKLAILTALKRQPVKATLLATAAIVGASAAIAQDGRFDYNDTGAPLRMKSDYYGYAASISPRVGYTNNINLAPDGLKDGSAYFSVVLSGAAIYSTKRFTGIVGGDVDFSYVSDAEDFSINQNFGGASTLTVAENLAYIDFNGSTSRQLAGDNARFSQNVLAARNQRTNVHSFSVSPYLYREFPDGDAATARYRFAQVYIDNSGNGELFNDSRAHEVTIGYNSGTRFQRARFAVSGYGNRSEEYGSPILPDFDFDQLSGILETQVALTSSFGLSGAIGYDDIDTDTAVSFFNDDDLSGVFWRAGFFAQPSRRANIRLEYGERFDNKFIDADASYRISERLSFSAGAGQSFDSRAQLLNSQYVFSQRNTLAFADALREGAEMSPSGLIAQANRFAGSGYYSQTSGVGVSESAYARLLAAYDRTEFSISGNYSNSDYGFRENRYISGNIDLRRELSRRLTGYGGVFVRNSTIDFAQADCIANPFLFGFNVTAPGFPGVVAACADYARQNGETTTLGGRIGVAYRVYENLSAFGEFAHTRRLASDDPLLEYGENVFLAGLTLDF